MKANREREKAFLVAVVIVAILFGGLYSLFSWKDGQLKQEMQELEERNPAVHLGDVPCELIKHNILYYPKCRFMDECAETCLRERGYYCYSKEDLKLAYDIKGC
jgi:hypothetical protein